MSDAERSLPEVGRLAGTVRPREASGLNISLIPGGPKWTIACGACPANFRQRIGRIDNPSVKCPECGTWNVLEGLEWSRD